MAFVSEHPATQKQDTCCPQHWAELAATHAKQLGKPRARRIAIALSLSHRRLITSPPPFSLILSFNHQQSKYYTSKQRPTWLFLFNSLSRCKTRSGSRLWLIPNKRGCSAGCFYFWTCQLFTHTSSHPRTGRIWKLGRHLTAPLHHTPSNCSPAICNNSRLYIFKLRPFS